MTYALPNGNSITYPALVGALAKPGAAILSTLTPEQAHAWHMASCIPGEAGELFTPIADHIFERNNDPIDGDNLIEELGDIEFYVEGLRAGLEITRQETLAAGVLLSSPKGSVAGEQREPQTMEALRIKVALLAMPAAAADVFDACKKWFLYNKPFNREAVVTALGRLEQVLYSIRIFYGITHDMVLAANVMKLGARYSSLSYSDQQAQDRADKKTVH